MTASPTFIAEFVDGQVTRMTTYTTLDKLDIARGVRLSRHAYRSRTGKKPPAIAKARFVARNDSADVLLAEYTAEQIKEAMS